MAFPTSPSNNQVHKEGNRAFVYDSTLGTWDQIRETDRTDNKILQGEVGSEVTFPALHGIVGTSGCHVYQSAASSASGSASSKVTFDVALFDFADEFSPNKFTVKTAGYYYIHVSVCIIDFADMKAMQARIYKNGSLIQHGRNNNGRADHLADSVTTIKYLAANDYIEGYVYNGWATAKNTLAGDNVDNFMTIMRLT